MNDRSKLLQKADRYPDSAEMLATAGDYDSAVSRAYYAAFFLAELLLDSLGQSYSSHRALISAYGQQFAKTGRLDPRFHRMLIAAFAKRQEVDYLPESGLIAADVSALVIEVKQFRAVAVDWLREQAPGIDPPANVPSI
ncbi:MAG: HEPN domain-containing protein [Thiohalocapsa sp.]